MLFGMLVSGWRADPSKQVVSAPQEPFHPVPATEPSVEGAPDPVQV